MTGRRVSTDPACPECGRTPVPLRRNGRVDRHLQAIVTTAGVVNTGPPCPARGVKPEHPPSTRQPLAPTFTAPRTSR